MDLRRHDIRHRPGQGHQPRRLQQPPLRPDGRRRNAVLQRRDGVHGPELWKSDGTGAGTVLVRIIHRCSQHVGPDYLTDFKGSAFFSADDGVHGDELWKSDGTSAGTVMVDNINKVPLTGKSARHG